MTLDEILSIRWFFVLIGLALAIVIVIAAAVAWSASDDYRRGMSDE